MVLSICVSPPCGPEVFPPRRVGARRGIFPVFFSFVSPRATIRSLYVWTDVETVLDSAALHSVGLRICHGQTKHSCPVYPGRCHIFLERISNMFLTVWRRLACAT